MACYYYRVFISQKTETSLDSYTRTLQESHGDISSPRFFLHGYVQGQNSSFTPNNVTEVLREVKAQFGRLMIFLSVQMSPGKDLCGCRAAMLKGNWGPGGHQAEYESVVYCYSKESKMHPVLHPQGFASRDGHRITP